MKEEDLLEFLNKEDCDKVLQDLSVCIEDWSNKDLDPEAVIMTLLRFSTDTVFKFSHSSSDALELIAKIIFEKIDENNIQDLEEYLIKFQDKTVH
mgnify:FL=1|tara:strand:- start:1972 stop:2256 length:285 start_codon:yes stop_codon:yes gene_type:complete